MLVSVNAMPVAIANVDGQYFAFQDLCPHRGTALAGCPLEDGCIVTYPKHSSRCDVRTRSCLQPDTFEAFDAFDAFDQDLLVFPVRAAEGVV